MKEAKTSDVLLLLLLGAIWGSSFFNIKIATYSFEPYTLALIRVILATLFLVSFSFFYQIKINAFSKKWKIYALVGLCNIAIPFSLIAVGTNKVDSYLAAILMSTTPLTGSILAHIFTRDEKITFFKSVGIIFGFSGVHISMKSCTWLRAFVVLCICMWVASRSIIIIAPPPVSMLIVDIRKAYAAGASWTST